MEQRRNGDKFRAVETILRRMHRLLAGAPVNSAEREQLEADVTASTAEWQRIGKRMLELDSALASLLRR